MVKTALQLSRGACFLESFPFGKAWYFFPNSELEQNFFHSYAESFRQHSENWNLRVHWNILKRKNFLFDTNIFFSRLWTLTQTFSNFQSKNFLPVLSKSAFNVSRGKKWGNFFLSKNWSCSTISGLWIKFSWFLDEKFLHGCRNCTCVSRLHLRKKTCRTLCRFFRFWILTD